MRSGSTVGDIGLQPRLIWWFIGRTYLETKTFATTKGKFQHLRILQEKIKQLFTIWSTSQTGQIRGRSTIFKIDHERPEVNVEMDTGNGGQICDVT